MRIFPFTVENRLFYSCHEADVPWLTNLINHNTVSNACCGECNEKKKEYCPSCPKHSRKAVS